MNKSVFPMQNITDGSLDNPLKRQGLIIMDKKDEYYTPLMLADHIDETLHFRFESMIRKGVDWVSDMLFKEINMLGKNVPNSILMELLTDQAFGTEYYTGAHQNISDMIKEIGKRANVLNDGFFPGSDFDQTSRVKSFFVDKYAMHEWRKFKKVFRFDKALEDVFINLKDEIEIPYTINKMIPFNPVYVEFGKDSYFYEDGIIGALICFTPFMGYDGSAFLEFLVNDIGTEAFGTLSSDEQLAYFKKNGFEKPTIVQSVAISASYFSRETYGTKVSYERSSFSFVAKRENPEETFIRVSPDTIRGLLKAGGYTNQRYARRLMVFLLNACVYLACKNKEVNEKSLEITKDGSKPYAGRIRNTKAPKTEEVTIMECGYSYGAALREYERKVFNCAEGADGTKKGYKPHPVRAHAQHYWTGKGRKILSYVWKEPYFTGKNNNSANVTNIEIGDAMENNYFEGKK